MQISVLRELQNEVGGDRRACIPVRVPRFVLAVAIFRKTTALRQFDNKLIELHTLNTGPVRSRGRACVAAAQPSTVVALYEVMFQGGSDDDGQGQRDGTVSVVEK